MSSRSDSQFARNRQSSEVLPDIGPRRLTPLHRRLLDVRGREKVPAVHCSATGIIATESQWRRETFKLPWLQKCHSEPERSAGEESKVPTGDLLEELWTLRPDSSGLRVTGTLGLTSAYSASLQSIRACVSAVCPCPFSAPAVLTRLGLCGVPVPPQRLCGTDAPASKCLRVSVANLSEVGR